jgi:hypothetical protein
MTDRDSRGSCSEPVTGEIENDQETILTSEWNKLII